MLNVPIFVHVKENRIFFDYKLLIDLLREDEKRERCHVSRKMINIQEILKQSGVRVFKIEDIKNLIAADKIEEALNLLRGQFESDNDVILSLGQLKQAYRDFLSGTISREDYRITKSKKAALVLDLLKDTH